MDTTISNILLAAKQHEIAVLGRLATKARLVGVIGHLIHALQTERGASSIYLASAGRRFGATRSDLIEASAGVERHLRAAIDEQLADGSFEDARQFYLMAWALLGVDSLPALRQQIGSRSLSPAQAVAAFSRLIAGLVSLLFEVAHAVLDPAISRSLVALFNFIQGKEHAGQERAVGALSFASGVSDASHQLRLLHLIDAQERCFHVFDEFASAAAREHIANTRAIDTSQRFDELRLELAETPSGKELDANLSREWFDCCTARLERMWDVQQFLVEELLKDCAARILTAKAELQDTAGLLQNLVDRPPASTFLVDRFFDPDMKIDVALKILPGQGMGAGLGDSVVEALLAQSERLATVENELEQARRALNERKSIERAKGLLMARRGLSEEAAYKLLRQTAMEQNKRMVDLADAMLSFQDWIGGLDSAVPPSAKP
ncbi:MAG TPA: nitrate- and nitrite sensing domain-containing protein [Rhodocyclaceae bacterium]